MNKVLFHRRKLLQTGLALGASLVVPATRAHEFFSKNLTVIHPWTRATAEGATSAIVSMTFEDVIHSDHLIGAQTPVATSAELGGEGAGPLFDFLIPEGQNAELSEGGVYLRLLGLKHPLLLAREYPMTLIFASGGAIRAALLIDYPAAA